MKIAFARLALALAVCTTASALPCGTVASPTPCSIAVGLVGSQTLFDFTNFQLVNSTASAPLTPYQGADINIDLSTGGASTALLTITKNLSGPTPGTGFFVNPGESRAFTFSYDVGISPVSPGTVSFVDPVIVNLTETHTNNAIASVQTGMPGAPVCIVFTGSTFDTCALPPGLGTSLSAGEIFSLTGNTGNTSVSQFTVLFGSQFAPDAGAGVPEPSSVALLGIGLVILRFVRRPSGATSARG
ncbi:MAG: PEP-CTERM sorting domain-containing protein [Bryobacteraceae bacterium]